MPDNAITSRIENGSVTPEEAALIEKSIKGKKEQAPSFAEQSGTFVDWRQIRDELGQPFLADRPPPLRKLKEMAKDPMLRFGLHYITTPHVRAQFHMEARDADGQNAQVAGFMDAAWRPIHARFMIQALLSLRWGHQPLVKRFATGNPGGVYRDETEENVENQLKPVWDEGSVEPIVWKSFVALDPGRCQPLFNDNTGEFDGIQYEVPAADRKRNLGFGSSTTNDNFREIDVYHSLWITHNRDDQFGSIYGFPRLAHAYRYWWSYWYSWAMVDRAIERMAVPPMLARHPEGDWEDPDNPEDRIPYSEVALDAAERLRSNAIGAVPSTLATSGLEERGTQQYQWTFEFLETKDAPIEQMIAFAQYCDIMKLRSLWVPEGALIEGEGGSAQRNIATQMAEIFISSQAVLFDELIEYVNLYVIPQILSVNFPEFVNNGGKCRIIGHGFSKEDIDLLKQLIQLVGQSDPLRLGVDIRASLERMNIPLLSPEQRRAELEEAAAAAQAVPPVAGVTAPAPTSSFAGLAPGSTNGGSVPQPNAPGASVLGFDDSINVYVQPGESITLSDTEDFITSLPNSAHYSDKTVRALMIKLRRLWMSHLRELYPDLAKHVNKSKLELADPPKRPSVTQQTAKRIANRILKDWEVSSRRLEDLAKQSSDIMEQIATRSAKLAAKQANVKTELDQEQIKKFVDSQVKRVMRSVHQTVVDEVRQFLVNEIRDDKSPAEIAEGLTEHFGSRPITKADEVGRSETRDAFNAGTLMSAEAAGLKYVRASDGELFDQMCKDRNGKLMTVNEAWREASPSRTHPRCQLAFELIARADFSVKNVVEMPEDMGDNDPLATYAYFESSTSTAYILEGTDIEAADRWLSSLIDVLVKEGYRESA